jgi:hypothetical protein
VITKQEGILIIQKVIKGIGSINDGDVTRIFESGIVCRWWQNVSALPRNEIPKRLNDRNLMWHQNSYEQPDPLFGDEPFCEHTPFISTTAGTVERDISSQTNLIQPAWVEALRFATNMWTQDGYLFYCYLFIIGKKSIGLEQFAEELRELNVYTGFSPYQPEGEITAKIVIPPTQIEKAEYWPMSKLRDDLSNRRMPTCSKSFTNPRYLPAEDYDNVRDILG